ncbi:hypothetical protein [Pseudomonas amygdali]|uniref:Lipoprotein n=2 Tax=Pseudomonas amygdali pv. lachrymans TaxID=53707 RepID=A0ABR5KRS9_PSEAV|nr:hypothetical protein [Pseudomonas amygdali]AXH59848.1 hypothetical protein PLA107_031995 [Pseudomonas amygdali pv. lachrymans str. M301315]KPC17265.1 Uncharacterized protein AC499_0467 [Pseudomonas amygdali pv. lachrymans]KPC18224.1 Uncharacterized protein AC499_1426 [Pseudomonas amygdali pv. lachrymans]
MKMLPLIALMMSVSCSTWASNIMRTSAPIAHAAAAVEIPPETPKPETPEPEPTTPGFKVLNAVPGQNGIYNVSIDDQTFPAYVDMTTNGGYWVLALYWGTPMTPAPQMRDLAVSNVPLRTWSANAASYPVVPSGITNVAKEGMIISTNPTWTSSYGAWQSFQTQEGTRVVDAANPIEVTTPGGSINMWLPANGWSSTTFATSGFGLFTKPNNSGECGGANVVGSKRSCPGYQGSGSASHFDMTYEKFYFLKGR